MSNNLECIKLLNINLTSHYIKIVKIDKNRSKTDRSKTENYKKVKSGT